MNKGIIFDIRRFSVNDGPGIRTTVFFKGCPLRCIWCHNPESQSMGIQECYKSVHLDNREFREKETIGRLMDAEQVMDVIRRDSIFYETSRGGVTFSGGEPLLQADFLESLLILCRREGFHTAIDTSGFAPQNELKRLLELTDLFLYDLKIIDHDDHFAFTGVQNDQILQNLFFLLENDKDLILRIPVIPGYTDTDKNINGIIETLKPYRSKLKEITLLPFHRSAAGKYLRLEIENKTREMLPPDPEKIKQIKAAFLQNNFPVKTGG